MTAIRTLIAVLAYAIALCGIVPLYPWLETAPRLVLAIGLAAGIWQERRGIWPVKNWLLNAAVVPVFIYYAAQFRLSNAVQPVVSVLAVMLAVRLFGEKSGRHYLQIHVLSLFCLASSSLFDLSPLFLAYLTMMLFMVALSLVLLTFYAQDSRMLLSRGDMRRVLGVGILMPLVSLPLLILFFPLLPRTQFPMWNITGAPLASTGGISEKVEPGASTVIADSPVLAFRAEAPRLPRQQLYWRATVFNRLDGIRWTRDAAVPPEHLKYGFPRVAQLIYPEPALSRFLIALDAAADINAPRARRNPDGTFDMPYAANKRISYGAESHLGGTLPAGRIARDFYLRLPQIIPPRISRLGEEIRRRGDSDSSRLDLLKQHFRDNGYRYSMSGLPTGEHALEQFLFEKKQGHCEFFASAFAILARSAGIPARLVGGYLGGEYNDVGGYYLVSENMAHVWVEAFLEGKGWVRIDPSSFAGNAGSIWGAPAQRTLAHRLRLALDSLDHTWNRSVIGFDFERQAGAARSAGRRLQSLDAGVILHGLPRMLLLPAGLVVMAYVLRNRRRLLPSREERLLRRFYRQVERQFGLRLQRGRQGLFEIAAATGNAAVREFVAIYAGALYRDRRLNDCEAEKLRKILDKSFM